jgi:hypothetical protein
MKSAEDPVMSVDIIVLNRRCPDQGGRAMIDRPRGLLGTDPSEDMGILVPARESFHQANSASRETNAP